MDLTRRMNGGWEFCRKDPGGGCPGPDDWSAVEIPHDWLIWNVDRLYEDGDGWYRTRLEIPPQALADSTVYLRFDGVYMDSTLWINDREAFHWKYGYSSFTVDASPYLTPGENQLTMCVRYRAPNARWYTGAGIYRDVWILFRPEIHLAPDGLYVSTRDQGNGIWSVSVQAELKGPQINHGPLPQISEKNSLESQRMPGKDRKEPRGISGKHGRSSEQGLWESCELRHRILRDGVCVGESQGGEKQQLTVRSPVCWSLENPARYTLESLLMRDGRPCQTYRQPFGFRRTDWDPDRGFFLNGRHVKIHGACQHHDLGCLGAAVNRDALKRQLLSLKRMGVNAIRTAHNMPAPQLMDLTDELGLLVCSEAFDMWELPKNQWDYARFFPDWAQKDVESWVRRDRNHPSLILWSIGNEVYDTQNLPRGRELTEFLRDAVKKEDPCGNGAVTLGSNYMMGENTQACVDLLKYAGYNYGERLYEAQHQAHPDWLIYGSETCSVVQSRGIYHFPLDQSTLADDDLQCSALGNSATSWGAASTEACILADEAADYSAGQFIWTGTDYIGEPTPYHSKNSYFGQMDTAGFEKDSFYVFQAGWTDWRENPMVHLFPYWDFSPGQQVDLQVCSNAPYVELFLNGISKGRQKLGLKEGKLIASYRLDYCPGVLTALAYDEDGNRIAQAERRSFGDAARICLKPDRRSLEARGDALCFLEISMEDALGHPVENANRRVRVTVSGAGRLVGLDSGDSTDYDPYKGSSKRLFSGKLLAVIAANPEPGEICVGVTGPGLPPASLCLTVTPLGTLREGTLEHRSPEEGSPQERTIEEKTPGEGSPQERTSEEGSLWAESLEAGGSQTLLSCRADLPAYADEIPVRKIELLTEGDSLLNPENPSVLVRGRIRPENASYRDLEWRLTDRQGIPSNLGLLEVLDRESPETASGQDDPVASSQGMVRVTAVGDGEIWLRCMTRNGGREISLIAQRCFRGEGLGKPFLNPYGFIAGGLYTDTDAPLTNGNERGVATPRDRESYVGFRDVDFGSYGGDTLTLPLFSLTREPFPIDIWAGIPGTPGCEKLCTVTYTQGSRWNTYIPQTFTLPRRLKGVQSIAFGLRQKVHLKGFSFAGKGFGAFTAGESDRLYGDHYRKAGSSVEDIGNNVTFEYHDLDFVEKQPRAIVLEGRTPLAVNSIQLRLKGPGEEQLVLLPFSRSPDYREQRFPLEGIRPGIYEARFVFLPGSRFDFAGFRFLEGAAEGPSPLETDEDKPE